MLRIDDTIFSLDIFEKKFCCKLAKCHGDCCRYGDSGAPLSVLEVQTLKEVWNDVRPYMRPEGIKTIEESGTSIIDMENESVTPLICNKECAYTIIKDGVFLCAIEQAWFDGKISFRKPLSCHLYPIRIRQFSDFRAVNYDEQPVCISARREGQDKGIYVYEFLKVPLIRAIGEEMYGELCIAAKELKRRRKSRQ
jgi:hypothetical protein